MLDATRVIHSTSWRPDGPFIVLTYVAVVGFTTDAVIDSWGGAKPIGLALADAVGPPQTNAANAPPIPRYVDVLLHAIRHLRFLLSEDSTVAAELDEAWRRHLDVLRPVLAGMYSETRRTN
jgi:hypothetical protein